VKERVKLADPEKVTIVPAELGDNGGVIGCALWAYQQKEG